MFVSLIKRLRARAGAHPRTRLSGIAAGVKLSLNDPRWGQKPEGERKAQEGRRPNNQNNNDGPPDLDQLWRDFNQRLNKLFGGKRGSGSGGDGFRPDARGVGLTVTVVGAIAALIWLASGAFIVQEGQVGIVTSFGKVSHTATAGFNWRWPAPFQAHELVNVAQVQTAEIGYRANVRNKQPSEALMLTSDENIVDVQFSVQYKIKDPVAWVFNNRDQVETVRDAAETVVRELVGKSRMDDVLSAGRDKLAVEARSAIQQLANGYGLGAEIVSVNMQSVQPPDQVASAFDDAARAQEDRAKAKAEAQAYADDILPQARALVARQMEDAEAYRAKVENTAAGNAARFDAVVAEYAKAPAVTRERMYMDTMQQVFSSTSKILIDAKTGTNQLYLPLDRMLAQSTANEAAIGSRSGPVMVPSNQQPPAPGQPAQPQPSSQSPQPGAPGQPAQQPAQAQPQPQLQQQQQQQEAAPAQPPQHRDLRSRENARERETR
ncbi:FtsH protease activity modulator HflK [Massilia sp. YIM B02763]|uniref:FtsH protease activity modulator HflK n=1 Tax=Massilia sp. YIM B02763 TaxID=3050130 RepID=UPI0025B63619|nr:FtsH protease activity modulator HflK [Massilia sp. YIM B02763]MDN4055492.1 FtsH protease activity modulator HflK [Massilia sp. YIM B02763]